MNQYKLFLDNIPLSIWITAPDSTIMFINKHYEKMYNIKLNDAVGKKNREIFPPEVARIYDAQREECLNRSQVYITEDRVDSNFVRCYMFPLLNEEGVAEAVAGIVIDINDSKEREIELESQKNILRTIIDALPEVIFYKDINSRFIGYNKKFEAFYNSRGVYDITGKTDHEIYGDDEIASGFIKQDQEILKKKEPTYFEYTLKDKNGNIKVEENVKIPVIDKNGQAWGIVGLSRDITERKTAEEKFRYLSEIDILTGLYNRYSFEEKIKSLNDDKNLPLGIIMGDVNGLKLVNDTLGHIEGDKLLKNIAEVLKKVCNPMGSVFRWGGDEFIILLPNYTESACEKVIEKIIKECNEYQYEYMQLSMALGETVKSEVEENIYEAIKRVEEKVYRQKLLEKKSIRSSIMESLQKSLEEKNMETELHTERVMDYALAMGKKLGFKIAEMDELTLVAKLHDIGKIGINEEILLKPGRLTAEEFEIMKTHTEKGYRIINASSELDSVAKCVLTHHERWDGSGYPLGLIGDEIPLMARIINIVDSYDVMTHDRVYKKAMSKEQAILELKRCSGTQFDPEIVVEFIDYILEK